MVRDHNDDKKRALVMGKFKFLYQDDAEDLEAGDKFQLAVVQNKLLGPVKYHDKSGKDPDVLKIYGKEREEGEGFSDPDIKIPGVLDLFTVVWSNPFGDLFIDQDIKLFEFEDIQKYSGYNDGPKSREFCRFYSSSASKELDGFDSSIFWSAGFLYRNFRTCGVEKWDTEMRDLVTHYKNWREWAHEVHNLPSSEKKRFSENPYSGPASTSTHYTRRCSSSSNKQTVPPSTSPPWRQSNPGSNSPSRKQQPPAPTSQSAVHYNPNVAPPSLPSNLVTAPPPGQTVTVPLPGPDGNLVQVQLVTMQPATIQPARYKYINPNHCTPSSSWTREVDDFLSRPKSRTVSGDLSSSPPRTRSGIKRREVTLVPLVGGNMNNNDNENPVEAGDSSPVKKIARVEQGSPMNVRKIDRAKILARIKEREEAAKKTTETDEKTIKKKTFKPRASIQPPSPGGAELGEVNELDINPESKMYCGEIIDWRGKFGFINCEGIMGKIFVHSKDFTEGRELAESGVEAQFQVLHQDSSVVGAKAVNVRIAK